MNSAIINCSKYRLDVEVNPENPHKAFFFGKMWWSIEDFRLLENLVRMASSKALAKNLDSDGVIYNLPTDSSLGAGRITVFTTGTLEIYSCSTNSLRGENSSSTITISSAFEAHRALLDFLESALRFHDSEIDLYNASVP